MLKKEMTLSKHCTNLKLPTKMLIDSMEVSIKNQTKAQGPTSQAQFC